jgi:hypothetical protein
MPPLSEKREKEIRNRCKDAGFGYGNCKNAEYAQDVGDLLKELDRQNILRGHYEEKLRESEQRCKNLEAHMGEMEKRITDLQKLVDNQ